MMDHESGATPYSSPSSMAPADVQRHIEPQHALAFESVGIALCDWDIRTGAVLFSREWKRQLGYADDELPNCIEEFQQRLHPDDRDRVLTQLENLRVELQPVYEGSFRLRHRDGRYRWFGSRATPVRAADGSALYLRCSMFDITETKSTEQALTNSERQLRACIALAPLSIAMFDRNMRYLAVSQRWVREYDRGRGDILGRSHYEIHPDIPDVWKEVHRRGLAGETIVNDDDCWIQADGSKHWLRWSVTPWRDGRDQIGGIIISTENVTERRRMEIALRESERRLNAAQRIGAIGSWEWDLVNDTITGSQELYRLLGIDPAATTPSVLAVLENAVHRDDCERMRRISAENRARGTVAPHEFRVMLPDGSTRWLAGQGEGERNAEGKTIRLFGVVQDITERKRSGERLHQRERQLRHAHRLGKMGYWHWSADSDETFASDELFDLFGLSPGAVFPKFSDQRGLLFTNESWDHLNAAVRQSMHSGVGYELDLPARRADGTPLWITTVCDVERDAEGRITGLYGIVQDITERKRAETEKQQLERQLQQAHKMEALGQLTAGIAHDFNNILAGVLGYSALALDRYVPDKSGKLAEYLQEVQIAGMRARDLIANLMVYSRSGNIERQPVLLGALAREVATSLKSTLPPDVEFDLKLEQPESTILADSARLHQIVMNLLINARDASGSRGRIELTVRATDARGVLCSACHALADGPFVELTVRDSGPGIPPNVLSRIFDPFFTTKPVGKGTGMGLSVVHGVVHECGGHIVVESAPGGGTAMRVLLPPAQPRTVPVVAALLESPVSLVRGGHILIVDDDEKLAQLFGEVLGAHGLRVSVFSDSEQALEAFRAAPRSFDVVLSDQSMPKLTGMELTQSMRSIRPELPIVLCTGYSNMLNDDVAARHRVELMYKPVSFSVLLGKIETLLKDQQSARGTGG